VTSGAECKNCGATLAGRYCSACGQAADVRIPSFGRLVVDALGDVFSFDSRVWRSLAMLVRPGRLTSRFLEGQRASYTPPFRLYIVTSLVFFAIFSLAGGEQDTAPITVENAGDAPRSTEEEPFGINVDENGWSCNLDRDLNPELRARLVAACEKIEADSGASFMRAFTGHFPVMMLVFIPLIAGLMKLLHIFSRRKYVEHLVFFGHIHAFFFLIGTITILLSRLVRLVPFLEWPVGIATYAAWIYFPIYLYLAMRHVYRQGHVLTALKYVLLGGGYAVAMLTTLLGLIVYTAVTL
jgi:Protein of unknown function (DUF3667)